MLEEVARDFKKNSFFEAVFDADWETRELKARTRHIATSLHPHLAGNYPQQVKILLQLIASFRKKGFRSGFEYMFIPDFIEQYGLDDPETSLAAMEEVTQFISCEFAIRPFLLRYEQLVLDRMLEWSLHPHDHVRRFSSEGCRPRLPWGMAVPRLKKDPQPVLPILENLKADPSLFVRKSVANNLNDIAKDHPEIVAAIAKRWQGKNPHTDWIIRHGSRTLLKKAHEGTYELFGLNGTADCKVSRLQLDKEKLKIGERMSFSFRLKTGQAQKLRLEYVVYYMKSSGSQSRKIFQLTEKLFPPGEHFIQKEQRFQDFTTRKHYPGKHRIAIVVNGREMSGKDFLLG